MIRDVVSNQGRLKALSIQLIHVSDCCVLTVFRSNQSACPLVGR